MLNRTRFIGALWLCCALLPAAAVADAPNAATAPYTYEEVMVPMRDGVRLDTAILRPTGAQGVLPILLSRTPYGIPDKAPDKVTAARRALYADGYIFVIQSLRGRFKSEGTFTLAADNLVTPGKGTVETRDAWDTIDWLVKNVPGNNGRVGIMGVSYGGYTSGATLLDPHPALKAVSEQASPADQWMNDDDHRYGALRLSYAFEYAVMEESDKTANSQFRFDRWDTYAWYLALGPLSNVNARYVHGKVPYWNELVQHPDYDAFWQSQAWVRDLHASTVPNLNVAGFWDQEDPWGPWQVYRRAAEHDPERTNLIVAGPWCHGCWHNEREDAIGAMALGHDTAQEFREQIEAPFFAYWLHGRGEKPAWQAKTFQTGSNEWRSYPTWPPTGAVPTKLYLHADRTLSFDAPGAAEKNARLSYVSDPANPVPYRPRPISPTYPGGDWPRWESGDQRFVEHRPDVLTFVSAPLSHEVTITGPVVAELYASTSGTDSDFVVKLIDVLPEDAVPTHWYDDADGDGPAPGEFAKSPNGYELPIAMEVRRGRYLSSDEHPRALVPNAPLRWTVPLRDRDHRFLAGHRIMVQVQSTWFPLIDRNPQTFTPSIYTATAADFVKATQTVYASPAFPSHLLLPVMTPAP